MSKHSLSKLIPQHAQELQDDIFRKMTPERRLHIAGEMYDFAKRIVASQGGNIYDRVRKASYKNRKSS